jgi:hypothetical protein
MRATHPTRRDLLRVGGGAALSASIRHVPAPAGADRLGERRLRVTQILS